MVRWNPLPNSAAQQGLPGVGKEQMQAQQTLCGLRSRPSLGHEPIGQKELTPCHPQALGKQFQPNHDYILGADGVPGQKKPMSAHGPFSEHEDIPSRSMAPKESRDDMGMRHSQDLSSAYKDKIRLPTSPTLPYAQY